MKRHHWKGPIYVQPRKLARKARFIVLGELVRPPKDPPKVEPPKPTEEERFAALAGGLLLSEEEVLERRMRQGERL